MTQESTPSGVPGDWQADPSMRTVESRRMDVPTSGVCGKSKPSIGRGTPTPGRGGGSRGGGVAGSQLGRGVASPPRILPPCRVCGLSATGFHYGANTCEACKAFFRRMVGRPAPPHYSCQGNCHPDPDRGLSCPHCRLQRCHAVGMSLKAVKRGRYTHERKAQNILEVKQLSTPQATNYDINSNAIKEPGYSWASAASSSPTTPNRSAPSMSPMPSPSGSSNASHSDNSMSPGFSPPPVPSFPAVPPPPLPPPPSPRESEMDALVERMVAVHRKYDELKPEHFKDRVAVEAKYKEERKLLEEMFGSMKPLDVEEYCRIYTETGVDVDGRQHEFIQRVVPLMEHRMYAHCAFLKALPGFKSLSSQDQIALMKASKGEELMLSLYKAVNVNEGIYYDKDTRVVVDIQLLKQFTNPEFGSKSFEMIGRLQSYNLNMKEEVLLKAVCFLCPDRTITSEGKENMERVQNFMVRELQRELLEQHPEDPTLTEKLLSFLAELRRLAYKLDIILARVVKDFRHIPLPPAFKEFISPEGMAYSVPEKPLPGVTKPDTESRKRVVPAPPPRHHDPVPNAALPVFVSPMLSDEPLSKKVNWPFLSTPPNPNSIQQSLGQTLASQVPPPSAPENGPLNGGVLPGPGAAFSMHNILEKSDNAHDSGALVDSRFVYPDHAAGDFGHFSFAHIFTQPLKFSRELEAEPVVVQKVQSGAQDDTERVITYENL